MKKKKRNTRKRFKTPSLWNMVVISFLVHIAFIYLIPAVNVFPPAEQEQYLEIEMTLVEPEEAGGQAERAQEQIVSEEPQTVAEVPTNLEPTGPEMVDAYPSRTEYALAMPERDNVFEPPQSMEMVSRTFLKPVQSDPHSLAVDFVTVGDVLSKPPADIRDEEVRTETSQHTASDDVTHEAEQPYEDFFKERDMIPEQDEDPEFTVRPTAEFSPKNNSQELLPHSTTLAKAAAHISQPSIVEHLDQRELAKVSMPRITLPDSTRSPDVKDESVIRIEQQELAFMPQETERLAVSVEDEMTFPAFQAVLPQTAPEYQQMAILKKSTASNPQKMSVREIQKPVIAKSSVRETPQRSREIPASPINEATPTPLPVERFRDQHDELAVRDEEEMRMVPERILVKESSSVPPPSLMTFTHRKQDMQASQPVAAVAKPVLSEPVSKRSLDHPLLSQKNIAYADEIITQAIESQRATPVVSLTPTPAALFTVKNPRTFEREKTRNADIALFQQPAVVKRGVTDDKTQATHSLASNQSPFGISVAKKGLRPDIEEPKKLAEQDDAILGAETQEASVETETEIEGPAARREVVHRPLHLPEVALDMEVELRLKFWVLPDGTVGDVVPLQRGDISLERAAIQYLKSWRFTPSTDGRKVWGVMPIKYTLQ